MEIRELTAFSQGCVGEVDALMHELAPGAGATEERVRRMIEDPNMHLYVIVDGGRIVACATLCVCHTPEKVLGFVEAVVVSSAYRGRHLGRRLMEHVIEQAREYAPMELHLTSNAKRIVANEMYRALGFERKETNCYSLPLGRKLE